MDVGQCRVERMGMGTEEKTSMYKILKRECWMLPHHERKQQYSPQVNFFHHQHHRKMYSPPKREEKNTRINRNTEAEATAK